MAERKQPKGGNQPDGTVTGYTLSDPVDADEGFSMIRYPDPRRGPWGIRANWVSIDGRPECVGLVIWRGADQGFHSPMQYMPHEGNTLAPVTATGIAELPIATIIDKLREAARAHWRENSEVLKRLLETMSDERRAKLGPELIAGIYSPNTSFEEPDRRAPGRPRRYDRVHFVEVAGVYLDAWQNGAAPTQAVADHFDVTRSTAAKWVAKARSPELQLLTNPGHGRGGAEPGPGLTGTKVKGRKR